MMQERRAARKLSTEIDRLLAGAPDQEAASSPVGDELAAVRRLREWRDHLPPVPPALRHRIQALVQTPPAPSRARALRPAAWGALVTTVVLLAAWMVVPSGQQVWAQMMRVLLGQTRVELTPTLEAPTRAVREPLRDLLAAELLMGRAPSLPRALPEGFALVEVAAVSYPDLPSWISQPLYVELVYGIEDTSPALRLRQYRLLFREYGGITGIQPADELVASLEEVDVSGVPGALLTFTQGGATHTVIWERDGLLLELETDRLTESELLEVARSVR